MNKEKFIDEFLNRLYLNGHEEDSCHYALSVPEATKAAEDMFAHYKDLIDLLEHMYINHKINNLDNYLNNSGCGEAIKELIKENNKH